MNADQLLAHVHRIEADLQEVTTALRLAQRSHQDDLQRLHRLKQMRRSGTDSLEHLLAIRIAAASSAAAAADLAARLDATADTAEAAAEAAEAELAGLGKDLADRRGVVLARMANHPLCMRIKDGLVCVPNAGDGDERWISLAQLKAEETSARDRVAAATAGAAVARAEAEELAAQRADVEATTADAKNRLEAATRAYRAFLDSAHTRQSNANAEREANSPIGPVRARLERIKKLRTSLKARSRRLAKKKALLEAEVAQPAVSPREAGPVPAAVCMPMGDCASSHRPSRSPTVPRPQVASQRHIATSYSYF
ncbi:uncharacterized protein AMSG_09015 [Thecamonas trahens ATCC 50062]|uniref:Uncharacterized protein n=1 Tax=Thecamonas trahens ATCC 50062 TaxID=461836 RepID=A0A0L0DN72_THETB|nr:hypothetical protein AMSG_09015 [Thecamonas trahens ATCC 50062]KNC52863.1 hypothetical protein AMSG_09015 [Thecamonas trahens ATCC 50062]|eukprot:XP_013754964.1 hypothetical protein AMSG_09015 [Thecamonas trahens ATCC 50062]